MRIYIAEDDPSVIGVLEDILESSALGRVCGASEEGAPDPERIMVLDPDLVLVDLLMPGRDGIQLVRELKELGSRAKFVMISQVSAKELIAKSVSGRGGVLYPEAHQPDRGAPGGGQRDPADGEREALHTIQSVFQSREFQRPAGRQEVWRRRIQYILSQLGMAGEKGPGDIMELCLFLLERKQTASQIGVGTLCSQLSDSPPRPWSSGSGGRWSGGWAISPAWGWRDYGNEFFTQYAASALPFPEVRAEMAHLRGKGDAAKVNLKKNSWTAC